MPRSSQSTDGELLEVELEPLSGAPSFHDQAPHTFRMRPIYLIVLGTALIVGLAMVPGADDPPLMLVPIETLPEPAVATTAPSLPALSQATVIDDTFELLRVVWPAHITNVVGPVSFLDHIWVIVSSSSNSSLTVIKSEDGADWIEVGEITEESGTMTISDLEAFGGSIVALGTITNQSGPAAAYGYPDQVVIWRSSDGATWDQTNVVPFDGVSWHPQLTLATDDRSILIGGTEFAARGQLLDDVIPSDLSPAVIEGRLDLVLNPGAVSTISVMAPPGIEVFRSDAVASLPNDHRNFLYRSQDLRRWEAVEIDQGLITWSGLITRPGRGFLARNRSGEMYSTIDGLGWGRNRTIPPADYVRWGEWLVGVQILPWSDRLMIGAGTDYAGIELPDDVAIWSESGELAGGSAGLVAAVPTYLGPPPVVSIKSGSQNFTLAADRFSISSEGSDTASVFFQQLPGSYDPATDEITIDLSEAGDHVVVGLDDLQKLRDQVGVWRTNVFASVDALSWAQSNTSLDSPFVQILGPIPDGFLIAVRTGSDYNAQVELYRTGPFPEGLYR